MTKRPYEQPISHQQKKRTSSGLISLLWMFVGALIAVMIGFFLYLSPLFDSFKTEVDVNPPTVVEPLPRQEEAGDYEFYEVLPRREFESGGSIASEEMAESPSAVEVAPDAVVTANNKPEERVQDTPSPSEDAPSEVEVVSDSEPPVKEGSIQVSVTPNSYILQIRSYDNPEDADRMRAEVMMSGVDARIVKRMDNGMEFYQVVSNVMHSKEEVLRASQRLSDNGIDSLIVEQRR